jgi:hypothetical protein
MSSLIRNVKRLFDEWMESYENELLNNHVDAEYK